MLEISAAAALGLLLLSLTAAFLGGRGAGPPYALAIPPCLVAVGAGFGMLGGAPVGELVLPLGLPW
ncbi:MAG: hypothetical protein PF443_07350, partial [Allgaiera sp.]|nr:hypothetical protein [Allgaiera sp.]